MDCLFYHHHHNNTQTNPSLNNLSDTNTTTPTEYSETKQGQDNHSQSNPQYEQHKETEWDKIKKYLREDEKIEEEGGFDVIHCSNYCIFHVATNLPYYIPIFRVL